jgi:hypothetical protein
MPEPKAVIEVVGEGKIDRGSGSDQSESPTTGVVPILVHSLCDRPESMRVRRRPLPFLQGKGLWQKVRFAKRQAFNGASDGLVFVLDTEGNHPGQLEQLQRGRDSGLSDYPTAVGVAHPCIEAWLLADPSAISRAMELAQQPEIPTEPESLPAPCKDRVRNPKVLLGRCAGLNRPLSSTETTRIAQEIRDLDAIRTRCPTSFSPFADEIIRIIKPIFQAKGSNPAAS